MLKLENIGKNLPHPPTGRDPRARRGYRLRSEPGSFWPSLDHSGCGKIELAQYPGAPRQPDERRVRVLR